MAGHTFISAGTAAVAGTAVDILADAGFTAKQVLLINDAAALTITVAGLGSVNALALGPKEAVVLTGSFKSLLMIEATAAATFRVVASDSTLPVMSITNIT
jgi:hypothetical protein